MKNGRPPKAVLLLHPQTRKVMKEFDSAQECCEFLKVTTGSLSKMIGKRMHIKGYSAVYKDEFKPATDPHSRKFMKPLKGFNKG